MLVFVLFHLIFATGAHNLSSVPLEDRLDATLLNSVQHRLYLQPSTRHYEERSRLLNALKHENGEWGPRHPRYKLLQALHDLYSYKNEYFQDLNQWKGVFEGLPGTQKEVVNAVTSHSQRFERFQDNQKENSKVVQDVLENALDYYGIAIEELEWFISTAGGDGEGSVNPNAVSDILNHLVRDWSTGGPHRRDLGSEPILESLSALYPDRKDAGKDPKRVLLPGSGLDRLAHEIAQLGGFEVTSNELSPHMNIVYRYAETLHTPEAQRFYPYIDWWSYQPSMAELLQEIRFPDVAINASDVLHVEGDFLSVFQNSTGEYDAVVTLFFLDTAQNIMDYLETIQRLLKPGGRWINLGTFLYGASPFLHLSLEDLVDIAKKIEFKFLDTDEKWGDLSIPDEKIRTREVCYLFNERAYRKKLFEAQFWIAEKM